MLNYNPAVLFLSIILISGLGACSTDNDEECLALLNGELQYLILDEMPRLIEEEYPWVKDTLNYPAEAREKGIEGTVEIEYAVSESGFFEELYIKKDIGGGCGEACYDFLKPYEGMQLFHPAVYQNENIKVIKVIPIQFRLE